MYNRNCGGFYYPLTALSVGYKPLGIANEGAKPKNKVNQVDD